MVPVDQNESTPSDLPIMARASDAYCTEQMVSCIDYTMIALSAKITVRQYILLKFPFQIAK